MKFSIVCNRLNVCVCASVYMSKANIKKKSQRFPFPCVILRSMFAFPLSFCPLLFFLLLLSVCKNSCNFRLLYSDSLWAPSFRHLHVRTITSAHRHQLRNEQSQHNFLPFKIDKKHFIPHCLDDWPFPKIKIKHTKDLSVQGNTIFFTHFEKKNPTTKFGFIELSFFYSPIRFFHLFFCPFWWFNKE